ncbi:thiol peroxidase [Tepidimicrobium xylanilyticum]|uniref:Thiol peroxidase n=1 Tax=Tepidimicrobium xylanilyticum TaxID=1123352 RepID=A0A1H3EPT1_9FIRM|nr:thiol peroxidase [Tepidimicrobium xylanilyticum]GMG97393.1 putative thiol peroxidase [Tepidimicrobium xylanilyticum]SDX79959.1 thiol peroxidase (atypical 2-Cys peroxiredoxin) [Tepidimicrobium xylanilyticum]
MVEKRRGIVTMGGNPVTLIGKEIKVGDKAPDFTALKKDLTEYSLKDTGDSIKIISVVPSLDTGICELQTIRFNEEAAKLKDVLILTISVDLPFAQDRFCSANKIDKVITLSDHRDLSFGLNYGFVIEEHRLLSRGIVVLDRDNTVRYVEYVKEVKTHPDYDKVLEEVKKLI